MAENIGSAAPDQALSEDELRRQAEEEAEQEEIEQARADAVSSAEGQNVESSETDPVDPPLNSAEREPMNADLRNLIESLAKSSSEDLENSNEYRELSNKEKTRNIIKKAAIRTGVGLLFAGATVIFGGVPLIAALGTVGAGLATSSVARGGVDLVKRWTGGEAREKGMRGTLREHQQEKLFEMKRLAQEVLNSNWKQETVLNFINYYNTAQNTENVQNIDHEDETISMNEMREKLKKSEKTWNNAKIGASLITGLLAGGAVAHLFSEKAKEVIAEQGLDIGGQGLGKIVENLGLVSESTHHVHALGGDISKIVFDYGGTEQADLASLMNSHPELANQFLKDGAAGALFEKGMHDMGEAGANAFRDKINEIAGNQFQKLLAGAFGAIVTAEALEYLFVRKPGVDKKFEKIFNRGTESIPNNNNAAEAGAGVESELRAGDEVECRAGFGVDDNTYEPGDKFRILGIDENTGVITLQPLDSQGGDRDEAFGMSPECYAQYFGNPANEQNNEVNELSEEAESPEALENEQIENYFQKGAKWVPDQSSQERIHAIKLGDQTNSVFASNLEENAQLEVVSGPSEDDNMDDEIVIKNQNDELYVFKIKGFVKIYIPEDFSETDGAGEDEPEDVQQLRDWALQGKYKELAERNENKTNASENEEVNPSEKPEINSFEELAKTLNQEYQGKARRFKIDENGDVKVVNPIDKEWVKLKVVTGEKNLFTDFADYEIEEINSGDDGLEVKLSPDKIKRDDLEFRMNFKPSDEETLNKFIEESNETQKAGKKVFVRFEDNKLYEFNYDTEFAFLFIGPNGNSTQFDKNQMMTQAIDWYAEKPKVETPIKPEIEEPEEKPAEEPAAENVVNGEVENQEVVHIGEFFKPGAEWVPANEGSGAIYYTKKLGAVDDVNRLKTAKIVDHPDAKYEVVGIPAEGTMVFKVTENGEENIIYTKVFSVLKALKPKDEKRDWKNVKRQYKELIPRHLKVDKNDDIIALSDISSDPEAVLPRTEPTVDELSKAREGFGAEVKDTIDLKLKEVETVDGKIRDYIEEKRSDLELDIQKDKFKQVSGMKWNEGFDIEDFKKQLNGEETASIHSKEEIVAPATPQVDVAANPEPTEDAIVPKDDDIVLRSEQENLGSVESEDPSVIYRLPKTDGGVIEFHKGDVWEISDNKGRVATRTIEEMSEKPDGYVQIKFVGDKKRGASLSKDVMKQIFEKMGTRKYE